MHRVWVPLLSLRFRGALWSIMLGKTLGVAFAMNCQDARESLSMLLGGDLSLTERVPLELHVNTCGECRQKLADLQISKVVVERAEPRPPRDWRPTFARWRQLLAHWRPTLSQWRPSLGHWRPTLGHWRPTLGHWRPTLNHWRPSLGHWRRPTLGHWRPTLNHWRSTLGHWRRPTLGHSRPTLGHWRPTLAAGVVGKVLGNIRTDDAATRLRRFVIERFEKFPPRHLAVAAAVPLVITLGIVVFERGFAVGTSIRQRPSSPPIAMRAGPPPGSTDLAIPAPTAPAPALPAPSTPSRAPAARAQAQPPKITPSPKVTETKAIERQTPPWSSQTESSVKKERAESAISSKTTPAKVSPGQPTETVRKESLATARTAPTKATGADTDVVLAAAASRRGAVDVVGRLQVKSRSEAERDLAALLSRAGGTSVSRRRGPAVTVVEAAVPHASYGKFSQGLVRLGSWRLEAERSPLPDLVQVSVRLAD